MLVPAVRRPTWRLVIVALAIAWLVLGVLGAYVYAHRYSLYRGFPAPVTPGGVARGTVRDVKFFSPALHGEHRYVVYLPAHYASEAARGRRFPVLYLLHGDPGKPDIFIRAGALAVQEDVLTSRGRIRPMIAVMPAGKSGLFAGTGTEWANAQGGRYEDYVLDVMRDVDRRFATVRDRRARGIAGLSEGGFGALNITLHNLSQFSVAESWSGYFNETRSGPFSNEPQAAIRANSPAKYVPSIAPAIRRLGYRAWIYQGRLDGNDPAHIRHMSAELHAAGAEVHYGFFPGGHDWGLWRAQLPRMLIAASQWFATRPRLGASAFTHVGNAGSTAAIRRYDIARRRRCLLRRAARRRAGRPPGTRARSSPRRPRTVERTYERLRTASRAGMMLLVSMRVPRSAAQALLLGAVALLIALAAAPQAGAAERCFGAASRDLEHPCFNPQLLKVVAPRRSQRCWRPTRRVIHSTARGRSASAGSGWRPPRGRRPSRSSATATRPIGGRP